MASAGEYRLGGTLRFDPVKEKYIVEKLDELSSSRRLSEYLITLIRLAFDDPKQIGKNDELINKISVLGMAPCAEKFYNECKDQMADMHKKINEIYNMCLSLYTLAKFGKELGLEKKSENLAKSEFVCEKQLRDLCKTLGIEDNTIFESNKVLNLDAKAADILEYILTHYDNIVKEVKEEHEPLVITVPKIVYKTAVVEVPVVEKVEKPVQSKEKQKQEVIKVDTIEDLEITPDDIGGADDELINLGDNVNNKQDKDEPEEVFEGNFSDTSDLLALSNMFSGSDD